MCKAEKHPIMVMDVEGTDGRERGEDQVSQLPVLAVLVDSSSPVGPPFPFAPLRHQDFERKSALFSLASSEVLLINLWEHQVQVPSPSVLVSRCSR